MRAEAYLAWRTSSYSGQGGEGCVDVAPDHKKVHVRHAKRREDGVITVTLDEWKSFLRFSDEGSTGDAGPVILSRSGDDTIVAGPSAELRFNDREWSAFLAGLRDGEFDFAA